jgi:hypothetical protein
MEKKRPPFIYQIYTNGEIDGVLQMTTSSLNVPHDMEMAQIEWSKSCDVMNFLMLSEDDFIQSCNHDDNFSLLRTHDNLLPSGLLLKHDIPLHLLYIPCTHERLNHKRLRDVFFMNNTANFHRRVRVKAPIWANFGYI